MTSSILWVSLILFGVALVCCACGFAKYVYFISIGYGFAITGQGIALLAMYWNSLTPWIAVICAVMIVYGLRLSLFLLIREIKSASYRGHMKTEIKDGKGMNFGIKMLLWVFCALLYYMMVSPVSFRCVNGDFDMGASFIVGVCLMIAGIVLESASDLSKARQKKANPKRFCDKGLFRIVRCPNYLGELILWTGVLVSGVSSLCNAVQWVIAILGYIGIVFVMFSGARRLEVRQNKNYGNDPEYQQYVKTVPILIPLVPLYSVEKYKFLVL